MEISIDRINERDDPYQLFLDSIKSPETLRKYKKALHKFLLAIPGKLYQDTLGKIPQNSDPATLSGFFIELCRKDVELATNIIATFVKGQKRLVEENKLHPNSVPNQIKPIKVLLDANRIAVHWKSIRGLLPRGRPFSEDRGYTREELQKMIEVSNDLTDKLIIEIFSSAGFRVDAWNYFTWKDIIPFKNKDGSYKGAALLVYRVDPESYWTFITPEACKTLELYKEKWKSEIGSYPKPDNPLVKTVKNPIVRRLNSNGIKKRIDRLAREIGLRSQLPIGKKRYEVPLDHGFRKYFNTMMRRAKVNYLDKEDMMGHQVGLEKHYERYQEEDFERFPEYQKAIPFLTISDKERLRLENQQKQQEIDELEVKNQEIKNLEKRIDDLQYGPKSRFDEIAEEMIKFPEDNTTARTLAQIFFLWFEMRATEDEKREIWKKLQQAKEKGETVDISVFGESKDLSFKNFYSKSTKRPF